MKKRAEPETKTVIARRKDAEQWAPPVAQAHGVRSKRSRFRPQIAFASQNGREPLRGLGAATACAACARVLVCVCARARVCVLACVCLRVCASVWEGVWERVSVYARVVWACGRAVAMKGPPAPFKSASSSLRSRVKTTRPTCTRTTYATWHRPCNEPRSTQPTMCPICGIQRATCRTSAQPISACRVSTFAKPHAACQPRRSHAPVPPWQ